MKELIEYISNLRITQGRHAGQPFDLLHWQRRFLGGAFKPAIGDAALTLGRGGGKTTLIAGICCGGLDGPITQPNAEIVVVASSFEQARIVFKSIQQFLADKLETNKSAWRVQDSANRAIITHRASGASVRCIGSDPRRAHGLQPSLIIADELAQWEHTKIDGMLTALRTSLGKIPDSRMIAIGTRPADESHPFERMLQNADYTQVHAARPNDAPFQRRTWKRANPSLDHLPDLEIAIRKDAAAAKRDPGELASFKALRLNMGVSDTIENTLIDAETWARVEADAERGGPYVLGLDLGSTAAMSAAAGYWYRTGRLDAVAAFPEHPGLAERGLGDGVGRRYLDMERRGELILRGKYTSDIGGLVREVWQRWGVPEAIVCDRWREGDLREALGRVRFPMTGLILRGQGYKDGSEDVRGFRRAVVGNKAVPVKSLLLRSAMGEARVETDAAGNSKLAKNAGAGRRLKARDDAAAAAILAVAEGDAGRFNLSKRLRGMLSLARSHQRLNRKRWDATRRVVLDRDGFRCVLCGRAGILEVDHVIPMKRGGDVWQLDNLQSLCRSCHINKTRSENPHSAAKDRWNALIHELT